MPSTRIGNRGSACLSGRRCSINSGNRSFRPLADELRCEMQIVDGCPLQMRGMAQPIE